MNKTIRPKNILKPLIYTTLALIAFAANSVLCRLALGDATIDAASFTAIRLISGVMVLLVIVKLTVPTTKLNASGSWSSATMLFVYAIAFSYAYVGLETGMGALVLFSAVQITIISAGLITGKRFHVVEWLGVSLAFAGFAYLVSPGLNSPPLAATVLMIAAGVAWGFYTLAGKKSTHALGDTTANFIRTLPFVVILLFATIQQANLSQEGVALAILSGGLASGIGYTLWYMALEKLSGIQAAVVQLLVPVIASIGGVIFAGEAVSSKLILCSVLILGGVLVVIIGKDLVTRKFAQEQD